jgi:hypothetical protein
MINRIALFIATTLLLGSSALMQDTSSDTTTETTATVGDDGTVAVTGITLPGQTASVPSECKSLETQTAKVVCAAEAFLATLTDEQKAEVLLDLTQENAVIWSNLPVTFVPRNGIYLGSLDATQLAAAEALIKTVTGTAANEGYSESMQLRMADDILKASGGMQGGPSRNTATDVEEYSSGSYFLAFLGTPSTTDTWILQFGGHHLAFNITYKAGEVVGATPKFTGTEPKVWTTADAAYAPLADEHDTLVAMLASLDETQLATAKLSQSFGDILLGPDADGQFPASKDGLAVSDLSDEQKALILAAIKPWIDVDDETAAALLATYEEELNETYIAFSGDNGLTNHGDYVRIDGTSVWIEFICQDGIVYGDQIHYHTVWRDHNRDYGAEFTF